MDKARAWAEFDCETFGRGFFVGADRDPTVLVYCGKVGVKPPLNEK